MKTGDNRENKMKLCFIAAASAVHTHRWTRYFASSGHEVHLISPLPLEKGDIGGAELYVLHQLRIKLGVVFTVINLALGAIQVRKLVKKINPDLVHARYVTDCGMWAALSGFHPCILRPMGSDIFIDTKRNPIVKAFIRYALRKADLVICNSGALKKGVMELGVNERKIAIINDGVDTQKFSPQQRDEGLRQSLGISAAPTVVSIRSLSPVYNVETLIRAVPLILKEIPEARFIIGGEGNQKEYLLGLASSLGISGTISFTGWIPHDELPKYLASADVYVSTSLSDGNSISLQEAMASELAPVVTEIPGNREFLIPGENSYFVPPGDHEKLAERIVYLLKNKTTRDRFGKAGRQTVMERAEYQKGMDKLEKIYQDLLQK
jgi:glycosyltransferase involved in cell wall biosynthesis